MRCSISLRVTQALTVFLIRYAEATPSWFDAHRANPCVRFGVAEGAACRGGEGRGRVVAWRCEMGCRGTRAESHYAGLGI